MAPLFPMGYLDQGWYLVIIFLIGLFFGLVLEQSGFSSSRKLAGVFYGYDMVVLKVFFTAGITAMAGLVILGYFGLIDLQAIFVNSNFLVSAVTGGVIMGFGFILGGFCPGTSITGAVIGKIDAMIFILGIFLGVFLFGAFDTTFNKLFTGYYFDGELLSETLGLPKHLMVLFMIIMALAAFGIGTWFEKRSTRGLRPTNVRYPRYTAEVFMVLLIGLIILFLPDHKTKGLLETGEKKVTADLSDKNYLMDADELAYLIINNPKKVNIIDVRDEEEFGMFHLPGSRHVPLHQVTAAAYQDAFDLPSGKVVLVSNGGVVAAKAYTVLRRKGYKNLYVLQGGINGLVETIFHQNILPEGTTAFDEISRYRFRKKAAGIFLNQEGSFDMPIEKKTGDAPSIIMKPMPGGC